MSTSPESDLFEGSTKTPTTDRIFAEVRAIREGRHAEFLALEVSPTEFLMNPIRPALAPGVVDLEVLAKHFEPKP